MPPPIDGKVGSKTICVEAPPRSKIAAVGVLSTVPILPVR